MHAVFCSPLYLLLYINGDRKTLQPYFRDQPPKSVVESLSTDKQQIFYIYIYIYVYKKLVIPK